jgi:peptide/nickel transport system substrate-binding protein
MDGQGRVLRLTPPLAIVALVVLASLGGQLLGLESVSASSAPHGTVTFALAPESAPNYISPFVPLNLSSNQNIFQFEELLYRPLYWFGRSTPTVNYPLSIGKAPVYSNGGRTVTISMNHYRWSDGQPVTNRDIEFWMNLLDAEKSNFYGYVAGSIPDNITSMNFPSSTPYQFSLTFNKAYSHLWLLDNQLSLIVPIPQHSWDRTSATGPVGNYDTTASGTAAVYTLLNNAATQLSTYTTNPFWKVVDGPWRLSAYSAATGYAAFVPNSAYSGPVTSHIAKFEELPFTTDAAEYDALRSGQVDYGYIPAQDVSQERYFTSRGYKIADWAGFGFNYLVLNFSNPTVGSIFKQLYFRQAMQRLIDQPKLVSEVWHGTAYPTYGPVPAKPSTPYLTKAAAQNPYPYSVNAAKTLLSGHGWSVHPDGTDVCSRPGTGSSDCGAGVASGAKLNFTETVDTGSAPFTAEVEAMQSAWSLAGIHVALKPEPVSQVFGNLGACTPSFPAGCQEQITNYAGPGFSPTYAPEYVPTGALWFANAGALNAQDGYINNVLNSKINATETQGSPAEIAANGIYMAKLLPVIWEPTYYQQVSVVSPKLKGFEPQDPDLNIYPETWTFN